MKAQDLKNSILQLAIQGKLVEQRKEEGTAKELIEKIKAEKEKLVKEGKIKKTKPLAEITEDEKTFDIPESWEWVKLGEIIKITTGNKDANHGVENGKYDFFTCSKEAIKSNTYSYDGECILLPGNGANVGLSIYYQGKFEAYQRTYVLEKLISEFNMKYLQVALEWNWKRYNSNKLFGSAIPYIKMGNLENYSFPLPPLAEQKRIVAKIEELMPYVEKYDKAYTEVEELNKKFPEDMQKSILQYAIQGKLVEQREEDGTAEELYQQIQEKKEKLIKEGTIKKTKPLPEITEDEIPFEIPENWKWVRLEQVCEYIQRGKSPKYSEFKKYPVVAQKCNQWSGFSLEKAKFIDPKTIESYTQDRILQDGDLMWNSTGLGTLGRVAIYEDSKNPYELAVADSHVTVIRALKQYVDFKYIYYYIANPSVQSVIEKQSSGSTKQIELATNTVKNYICPLPPLEEQKRIVEKIEELLPYTKQLVKKID